MASEGGSDLEAVGPAIGAAVGHLDVLDAVQSASAELSKHKSVAEVAQAALTKAVELTKSAVAFLALADDDGEGKRVFSMAEDPNRALPEDEIERIFATAAAFSAPMANATWSAMSDASGPAIRSTCAQSLQVSGRSLGMIGVASPSGYTAVQQKTFAIFANQVAAAIAVAQLGERRQAMIDTLVNLRADLDRRLTRSIAELVAAEKVVFWQLEDGEMLQPIAGAHGVDNEFMAGLRPASCSPDNDDVASRVVFHDLMFRAARTDDSSDFRYVLDTLGVRNAVAVPWRAGDQRLGLVAAYDSRRVEGISREDTWVLQKAGLAAGLVWQLKYAERDLKRTAERLEKVDAARLMLLKNVSTAVDKARKRFAGDLHDDALQKLTAVELQLQRLREPNGDAGELLAEAQGMLAQTEEALRRLLFEVRPPALEVPGGFVETIRARIQMLKSLSGAEVEVEVEIPDALSYDDRSMLFRQLTEALTNVEKHASATQVRVSLKVEDGGVRGVVQDNGRGFVVAERDRLPGHLGLLALHERALLAGGWNKVESEPGLGTRVEFWLPIAEAK